MAITLKPYDVAQHLDTEEEVRLYLAAAVEDGDPVVMAKALAHASRARSRQSQAKRDKACDS